MKYSQITEWCHEIIRTQAKRKDYILMLLWERAQIRHFCVNLQENRDM